MVLGSGDWSAGGAYDLRAYGVLWLADPERALSPSETAAVVGAVEAVAEPGSGGAGTGLLVFADWWDATLLAHSEFADDNTRGSWQPATGGADVPGLNALLARWGVGLGQRVYAGVLGRGGSGSGGGGEEEEEEGAAATPAEPRSARFASGVAVVHVPASGSHVYWASLRDQSGPARASLLAAQASSASAAARAEAPGGPAAAAAAAGVGAHRSPLQARPPRRQQHQRGGGGVAAAASYHMVPVLALVDAAAALASAAAASEPLLPPPPLRGGGGGAGRTGRVAVFGDSSCLDDALAVSAAAPTAANGFRGPCWWVVDAALAWLDGGAPPAAGALFGAARAPRSHAEATPASGSVGADASAGASGGGVPLWWPDPLAEPPPLPRGRGNEGAAALSLPLERGVADHARVAGGGGGSADVVCPF